MIDVSSPHACMVALESIVGNNVHCIYACMADVSYFVARAFFPDVISAVEVILTVLIGGKVFAWKYAHSCLTKCQI